MTYRSNTTHALARSASGTHIGNSNSNGNGNGLDITISASTGLGAHGGLGSGNAGAPSAHRRLLLGAALGSAMAPWATLSLAAGAPSSSSHAERRFVLVILRGGMDGLTAAPVLGDPAFADARGLLGQFTSPVLPLQGPFALHPLLPELHAMYGRGEMALLHAAGLPYRERSHFDAQQVLESGGTRPYELTTGWLARALPARSGHSSSSSSSGHSGSGSGNSGQHSPMRAVALETAVPLVLRGATEVDTWAPSTLPEPAPDLVARLESMYRSDPALAQALARARGLRAEPGMAANPSMAGMAAGGMTGGTRAAVTLARKAAEFLQRGSQIAVLEMGGWDSHTNQSAPNGATSNNLRTLDALVAALREGLQPNNAWAHTVVLVATEFGREVAVNGNGGTDHGTGGAAFVLGGAVNGGRVFGDWPGLAKQERHEGRDLRVTTDLRAAIRPILADHLRVSRARLDNEVLPGSASIQSLDLLRG
jgi:uncharacterized protein (DUF1501 family)